MVLFEMVHCWTARSEPWHKDTECAGSGFEVLPACDLKIPLRVHNSGKNSLSFFLIRHFRHLEAARWMQGTIMLRASLAAEFSNRLVGAGPWEKCSCRQVLHRCKL